MPSVKVPQQTQQRPVTQAMIPPAEDNTIYYLVLVFLFIGLGGALFWWYKTKNAVKAEDDPKKNKKQKGNEPVDADKEMEWFRKHQNVIAKDRGKYPKRLPKTSNVLNKKPVVEEELVEESIEVAVLREKMQKKEFLHLPINTFSELKPSKTYQLLPISNNTDLMSAVEQASDEFEEDEEVRDLAVRVLAAFKTRNSVESLGQIALYDLSSNLRSKAVSILSDFDHESVFETILLACADPTREVRAAAARGLFRLSFDRADAWTRIAETNDEFRMRQAARAASEADLVYRLFDRLVHEDKKIAYEAFAFVTLLIKAGETEKVFEAIENHQDSNVKKSLLHVIETTKDSSALDGLYTMLEKNNFSEELRAEIDKTIQAVGLVAA
ncbi:MAG TPA: HEAT repeat domain-containing protein [Pyrinomonadaceae bacterium]|nr:HEAT repeat domain-containing protein [Pyrinomonadaceae bacterium]